MAFVEDFDAFFNTAEFAVEATYGASTITVIFDEAYSQNLDIAGSNPTILARVSDMGNAEEGEGITINGTVYTVAVAPQADGTGLVRIELERA